MTNQTYTLEFDGRAGDSTDVYIQTAIDEVGGKVIGCGTFLMSNPPQRDIQFIVPADRVETLTVMLSLVGVVPRAQVP
jgi:hypothetical protein